MSRRACQWRHCRAGIAAIALLTAGCNGIYRAYQGPPLPAEGIATLRGAGWNYFIRVTDCDLLAVDGQRLGFLDDRAEVLPGHHTFRLQLWEHELMSEQTRYLYCDGELEALAGRDYQFLVPQQGLPSVVVVVNDGGSVTRRELTGLMCREHLIELELLQGRGGR